MGSQKTIFLINLKADFPIYDNGLYCILRAALKFGRRVHFALRWKMRKPPITRVPAIFNALTNRPSWKTDSIYGDIVKWRSTRPWIRVNSKFEWKKWPLKSISTCIRMHCCLPSYSVPKSWHLFVELRHYLLTYTQVVDLPCPCSARCAWERVRLS